MSRDKIDLTKLNPEELQRLSGQFLGKHFGSKGGKNRAQNLTPKRLSDIAKKAAAARWGKKAKGE